ncbi:hypothetical protein GCM10011380_13480 [Sphingomonas metalli]|uniref:Uncharacterized protein n=1 Tax=Sphingomonas metalli TaxID=1779358 RepID=A0A916T119_9SPHN|nr:hypothetical protein GCM10011380_13480 [Sphingomonas metalli]
MAELARAAGAAIKADPARAAAMRVVMRLYGMRQHHPHRQIPGGPDFPRHVHGFYQPAGPEARGARQGWAPPPQPC